MDTKTHTPAAKDIGIETSSRVSTPRDAPGQTVALIGAVDITSPGNNAFVGPSSTIFGNASLTAQITDNETGVTTEVDSTMNIGSVVVKLNNGTFVNAVATGSGDKPWATWKYTLPNLAAGSVAVKAQVSPATTQFGTAANRTYTVDAAAPSLTINPVADVLRPGLPYTATITGSASDSGSGVGSIEWWLSNNVVKTASGTTAWTAAVDLPSLGSHTVTFRARDNVGNASATQVVTVRVGDNAPPSLDITEPHAGDTFSLKDGPVSFTLRGTASDIQTGVATVEWALDGQTGFTTAIPTAAGNWSAWSAPVSITTAGSRTITVRARDKETNPAPNQVTKQLAIVVAEPFVPADPEAVFSPTAYLDDLLNFSTHRAKTSATGALITRQLLVDTYLQPFVDLVKRDNRTVANQSANQVRLCIEVLRRYLTNHGRTTAPNAEIAYRQAAYYRLLRQLGTSYDEIRLARVAADSTRSALASRLGIAATQFRPDRLDQLLLQPVDITESKLRSLFGLEETTVKPLADSLVRESLLLIWQKENLRGEWQEQDSAARTELDTPLPVIDPDLLTAADFRTASAGNAAYDTLTARRALLLTYSSSLDAARKAQATQLAGFDAIVGTALGPVADLLSLLAQRDSGNSIDIPLRAMRLTLQPFLHLMRVRQLAAASSMLDAEWEDVYAILTQVKKLSLHASWRTQEQQSGLILGPDYFQLSDAADQGVASLPRWRATSQARQTWRRTLESRIQQELALTQAMQAAVSATEEATLPQLRDACIAAIAAERNVAVIADALTQELGIDCKDNGHLRITRAEQALETLQEVLLSLRTVRFKGTPPVLGTSNPAAAWVLALDETKYKEADFDEEWRWMGGYATWNAAMLVFAYPEAYLLPELRPSAAQTKAYRKLMADLRNQPRLTPLQARNFAATYLDGLTTEVGNDLPAALRKGALVITEQLTDTELATRRASIQSLFGAITTPSQAPNYLQEIFFFVPLALALQLQKSGQYLVALDWIETFYTDHLAPAVRKIYYGLVLEETIATQYQRNPDNWLRVGLNPHEIAATRASAYTRFTLTTLVRCYLDFADAEFTRDDGESLARARALYGTALQLLALPEMQSPGTGSSASPFPPNPVPRALQMRGELNLFKLRTGRNIAGIERDIAPVTQPALTLASAPTAIGSQPQFRPTPYRYGVLVERAKNLVSIAQQVEQAFLAALEKRDAEVYNLLKAGHDLNIAGATVDLQALRVSEAEDGITLAQRQLDRATTQRDTYQARLDAGLNSWERDMLGDYKEARNEKNVLAGIDAALTVAQTFAEVSSGGFLGTGLGAGLGGTAAIGLLALAKGSTSILINNAEASAQINSATASFERREEDWETQRQLAESDINISSQQVELAQTHSDVARQEETISRIQQSQAEATVEFLAQKFTNAELYAWMSGILGGAYNYFLQQATALAQLAQYQLAFERQEAPPAFIKADYWDATDDSAQAATNSDGTQTDRRGLTGSVRLLQDITRLDQFAFETNRRKLQLTETFSLARLFPLEFQNFRETGRLPFATPMALFDSRFPGHYLRLIKRARVSLIALVSPTQGIRATLIASGISRVVTRSDTFQSTVVRRDPELIAFTSTSNASGLFDLEPEAGMLLPFESMGVDTHWELQLPKAANPFDYRSIADVLFTLEYTALQDFAYRQQVIQQLDNRVSAERVFSIRDHFADQWYALHNPERAVAPMTVQFALTADDFPPNLSDVRIQQVFFAVAGTGEETVEMRHLQLLLVPEGETVAVGGSVDSSTDGLISTRRGNASAWVPLIGKSPAGAWQLTLPDNAEMRSRFANEEIDDLLLVLTYEGRTPAWPV